MLECKIFNCHLEVGLSSIKQKLTTPVAGTKLYYNETIIYNTVQLEMLTVVTSVIVRYDAIQRNTIEGFNYGGTKTIYQLQFYTNYSASTVIDIVATCLLI